MESIISVHLVSAILFALSANMDNVAIGLAYGIRGVNVRLRSNLLIAFITSLGTLASMSAGATLSALLPENVTGNLGCLILIGMGLWFIVSSLRRRLRPAGSAQSAGTTEDLAGMEAVIDSSITVAETGDIDAGSDRPPLLTAGSQTAAEPKADKKLYISPRETLILALALMVNNLGFGVGAEIAGLPVLLTSACTLVCSMLLLSGGVLLGKHFGNTFVGRYTDLISGFIIVALGIYEFLI